jgi:IS30 family transposase
LNTSDNAEKRRNVIELRKEGKTIREIANQMHKSSRTVIDILKDNNSKEEREYSSRKEQGQQNAVLTNYTKALRLFKEGKSHNRAWGFG